MNTQDNESTCLISSQENASIPSSEPVDVSTKNSFNQSVFNIAKMCIGTGTLGLPFAASQGGVFFNIIGLFSVTAWNVYSVDRLMKSHKYIRWHERSSENCNITRNISNEQNELSVENEYLREELQSSGTFGKVAWYAFGLIGLHLIDAIMMTLMFGIVIAYEDAILGFLEQTPLTTGTKGYDALLILLAITPFACISEFSAISKFSAFGIFAIVGVFVVVACYGVYENGLTGFGQMNVMDLWPDSLTAFSHWFGVVAFSFGIVPFAFNLQESMVEPTLMSRATQTACIVVFFIYVTIGSIINIIFLPTYHKFESDVLATLPNTWISTLVRLVMSLVMVTTLPLILVPTGDFLLRKITNMKPNHGHASSVSLILRLAVCVFGALISVILADFVHVISFLGCFCVAFLSFAYPPLLHIVCYSKYCPATERSTNYESVVCMDMFLLFIGTVATAFTSVLTYRTLLQQL